ncbi:hypothetical protein [Bradyrhizobium elkanii]|uniref:hypothetical protein n=1 Tax=Bradyrhizobium elkanii TaxID=29448 RepID=UPI0035113DA4
MTSLPSHGRISCTRCFSSGATWGATYIEQNGWILENNPLSWGSDNPRYLVLGFSKGTRQCDLLQSAQHDQIPFAGFRHNVTAIVRKLGLLGPNEQIEDRIQDKEQDFGFGSLIRCSVAHLDPVTNKPLKSGDIIGRLSKRTAGNDWVYNCMHNFLSRLPPRLEVVVLLSNDDSYIEACFSRLRNLHPGLRRINSVAYSDGQVTWIHTVHGSPLAQSHINAWLAGNRTIQGEKQRSAIAALSQIGFEPARASKPTPVQSKQRERQLDPKFVGILTSLDSENVSAPTGEHELHATVQRGRVKGSVLVPHRHADGCFVVSMTRFESDYIRLRSIQEVVEHLRRGYSLRMSALHGPTKSPSLISPSSIVGWRKGVV